MAVIKIVPFPGPKGDSFTTGLSVNNPISGTTYSEPYNLQLSDSNTFFNLEDGTQQYFRVPADSTINFTVGTKISFNVINSGLYVYANNEVTSIYATGQSGSDWWFINNPSTGVFTLTKIATNKWILDGQGLLQD